MGTGLSPCALILSRKIWNWPWYAIVFFPGNRDAAFESGAAPITLINGEKLVDLLIENGIGVTKRNVELWKVDSDAFENWEEISGG